MDTQTFTTLDAYLSGYLALKGFKPHLVFQPGKDKVVFSFQNTPELLEVISEYNQGGKVEALNFAVTIKALKSQIHSRRNKDHENEKFDPRGHHL